MAESLVGEAGLARAVHRSWCPQALDSPTGMTGHSACSAQGGSRAMGDFNGDLWLWPTGGSIPAQAGPHPLPVCRPPECRDSETLVTQ